jgi:hypothetical protein
LLECVSRIAASDPLREQARELRWLSVALVRKFRDIRLAVNLMVIGLAVAAIAAVIARA